MDLVTKTQAGNSAACKRQQTRSGKKQDTRRRKERSR